MIKKAIMELNTENIKYKLEVTVSKDIFCHILEFRIDCDRKGSANNCITGLNLLLTISKDGDLSKSSPFPYHGEREIKGVQKKLYKLKLCPVNP